MTDDTQIIMNTLERMADKIGGTAADVARIFIEAQAKIGIVNLIAAALVVGSALLVFLIATYLVHREQNWENSIGMAAMVAFIWILVIGVLTLIVLPSIYMVVAPEYMGLKDLVSTISRVV